MHKSPAILIAVLLLTACAASADANILSYAALPAAGDPAVGQAIFQAGTKNAPACSACHVVDNSPPEVGPLLKGIANAAGSRVAGQSAEVYLFTSIVNPNAYLVPGYAANIMPQTYAKALTSQQIRDVISYLQTLK